MTEFGDEMKRELEAWGSNDPAVKGVKEKKEKVVNYTVDVSDCDMVITRNLNGKDTGKLFLYLSQTDGDGKAICFIKKMKGGTREALTESNVRAFFDGLSAYYQESLDTGSQYIPKIRKDTKFIRFLLGFLENETAISWTRKGMLTTEVVWNYKQNDYRNILPWYVDPDSSYSRKSLPIKVHERVWQHIYSKIEEMENVKRSRAIELVFSKDDRNNKYRDATLFEYLADIFDDFFAIKCFDEYMDNHRLGGLRYESYSYSRITEHLTRLFTIRTNIEGTVGRYDGGYYGVEFTWENAVNDLKEQVPFFVRFEKNRFWDYLQHSMCLGLGSNLDSYIVQWKDYLEAAQQCDGKIKDKYPEHLQEAHDIYSEKARVIKEFKESSELLNITEVPSQLCDMEHNGMTLRTLRTVGDYTTEAQQNANCVATYVKNTLTGRSWVCSFRPSKSDITLLTVEVNKLGEMCQIKGKYNREPTTKEFKELSWFQKEIFKRMADRDMPFGQMPKTMIEDSNIIMTDAI